MLFKFASRLPALCALAAALWNLPTALGIPSSTNGTALGEADFLPVNSSSLQYDVFPVMVDGNVHCDAQRYGLDLVRSACENALQNIGTSPDRFTVAHRGPRLRPSMVLPNRWPSADLKCVIDLTTAPGIFSDTTSHLEIRQAADRVINGCVKQQGPTSGGSVGAVGNSGNLIVIVRLYKPQLTCDQIYGQPPAPGSCSGLVTKMPVSINRKLFGRRKSPGVEEVTPITTRTRGFAANCAMTIDTMPLTGYGNWFDLWQGAVAVEAFCVAHGSAGMAWGIGEGNPGNLRVVLRATGSGNEVATS